MATDTVAETADPVIAATLVGSSCGLTTSASLLEQVIAGSPAAHRPVSAIDKITI